MNLLTLRVNYEEGKKSFPIIDLIKLKRTERKELNRAESEANTFNDNRQNTCQTLQKLRDLPDTATCVICFLIGCGKEVHWMAKGTNHVQGDGDAFVGFFGRRQTCTLKCPDCNFISLRNPPISSATTNWSTRCTKLEVIFNINANLQHKKSRRRKGRAYSQPADVSIRIVKSFFFLFISTRSARSCWVSFE